MERGSRQDTVGMKWLVLRGIGVSGIVM